MRIILGKALLLVLLAFGPIALMAEGDESVVKNTLSGYIHDQKTGEDLIGATVYVKEIKSGTTSNIYGFYSISLPAGQYSVVYSYVGYTPVEKTFDLKENITFDVHLALANQELEGVVITGTAINDNVTNAEMSSIKMDTKTIKQIPALMGEVDIIKAIQLLPGVQSISEGSSGFSVRGGSLDQNLIQLDEATVYNAFAPDGFLFGVQ